MGYLYFGRVCLGSVCGYLWVLGLRVYFRRSWRDRPVLLGHLDRPWELYRGLRRFFADSYRVLRRRCLVYAAIVSAFSVLQRCRVGKRDWRLRSEAVELLRVLLGELRGVGRLCRRFGFVDIVMKTLHDIGCRMPV